MDNSERLFKWDNTKAILIFVVVLGHFRLFFAESSTVMSCVYFWENLFNMPGFIFVAGLFSKNTINNKRYYKIIPYIFLYLIMKVLIFCSSVAVNGGTEGVTFDLFYEDEIPWFALSMIWWHLITIGASKVKPVYVFAVSVIVAIIVGYAGDFNSFLAMNRAIVFFPFFYLGYITDLQNITRFLNKVWVRIIAWIVVIGSFLLILSADKELLYWVDLFKGCLSYSEIYVDINSAWGGVWRIIAYVISLVMTISVIAIAPRKKIFLMSGIGKRTLAIFALHIPVMILVLSDQFIVKPWMVSGHIAVHCLLLTIAIVLFLSIPVFDYLLRKLMSVPIVKSDNLH